MAWTPRSLATLLVSLAAALAGCADTDCDRADDRIEACGVDNAALTGSGAECGDRAACEADCVLEASCEEIVAVLTEGAANDLSACVIACATPEA